MGSTPSGVVGCVGSSVGVVGGHLIGPATKDGSWLHGSSVGGAPVLLPIIPRVTITCGPPGVSWVPGVLVAVGCIGRVGSPLPLVGVVPVVGGHLIGPATKDGSWLHGSSVGGAPVLLPIIPRVTITCGPPGVSWVPGVLVAVGCIGRVGSPLPLVGVVPVVGGHLIGPATKDGSWLHGSSVGGAPVLLPIPCGLPRGPDGVS